MVGKTKASIATNSQGKTYMYISRELIRDSAFPFDLDNDELMIRIDDDKLIIEKE